MMRLVKVTRNLMAVCGLVLIGLGVYLLMNGNISITQRTEDHNITVIRDGEVQSSRDWSQLLGYEFKINLLDGVYIGQ